MKNSPWFQVICASLFSFGLLFQVSLAGTYSFESGSLGSNWSFYWQYRGTYPSWDIVQNKAYSGTHSLRSPSLQTNQSGEIFLTQYSPSAGTGSFWFCFGTTPGNQQLSFYIDGAGWGDFGHWQTLGKLSGPNSNYTQVNYYNNWTQVTFPVLAGTHTYQWHLGTSYMNDTTPEYVWIDNISLPGTGDNVAPVANAGSSQTKHIGQSFTVSGAGSTDPENDPLTYQWSIQSKPSGSNVNINSSSCTINFTPDKVGSYQLLLTVSDGYLNSQSSIIIAASDTSPVATSLTDQTIKVGWGVTLSAVGSTDSDGDTLNYHWSILSKPNSSSLPLNSNQITLIITPDIVGIYQIQLIVDDGYLSDTKNMTIQVVATDFSISSIKLNNNAIVTSDYMDATPTINIQAYSLINGITAYRLMTFDQNNNLFMGSDTGTTNIILTTSAILAIKNPGVLTSGQYYIKAFIIDGLGNVTSSVTSLFRVSDAQTLQIIDALSAPNPFNPTQESAHIGFQLNKPNRVNLMIFGLNGLLIYSTDMQANYGYNEFVWNGRNKWGSTVANDVYFAVLTADDGTTKQKTILKIAVVK